MTVPPSRSLLLRSKPTQISFAQKTSARPKLFRISDGNISRPAATEKLMVIWTQFMDQLPRCPLPKAARFLPSKPERRNCPGSIRASRVRVAVGHACGGSIVKDHLIRSLFVQLFDARRVDLYAGAGAPHSLLNRWLGTAICRRQRRQACRRSG